MLLIKIERNLISNVLCTQTGLCWPFWEFTTKWSRLFIYGYILLPFCTDYETLNGGLLYKSLLLPFTAPHSPTFTSQDTFERRKNAAKVTFFLDPAWHCLSQKL